MTGIGTAGYSNSVRQTLVSNKAKSTGATSPGLFRMTIVHLTKDALAYRNEVKERAKLKSETGERWMSNPLFKTDLNSRIGYRQHRATHPKKQP